MNKNAPIALQQTIEQQQQQQQQSSGNKRLKRKISKTRLPTPPPDPNIIATNSDLQQQEHKPKKGAADKDAEMFEYLETLQKEVHHPSLARSTSTFASAIATEDAFDHLDKLYKLMEQMLALREQNAKLHRRVRDLEHLRNLQNMNVKLDNMQACVDVPELDNDSLYAERLLETMLLDSKKEIKSKLPSRFRQSILRRQRNRSSSMGIDKSVTSDLDAGFKLERRASTPVGDGAGGRNKHAKVSKWTKVKAAFKWERASSMFNDAPIIINNSNGHNANCNVNSDSKGLTPVNFELARYLRVPSTTDEIGTSVTDSGAADISTPGTISLTSSIEDIHAYGGRKEEALLREYSSDDDQSYSHDYIPHSKDEPNLLPKSTKLLRTPWAKMKDIIQTRNSLKKKHRLSAKSDDIRIEESIESDNEDVFDEPKPTRIHFADEICKLSDDKLSPNNEIPATIIERYHIFSAELDKNKEPESRWHLVKKAFITNTAEYPSAIAKSGSSKKNRKKRLCEGTTTRKDKEQRLHDEIQQEYKELQEKLSLEFHDKFHEWEKSKQSPSANSACPSAGSPTALIEDVKDPAFMKKIEEWEKIKSQPRNYYQMTSEENLPPDFKKKLQEWQRIKKSSTKEDGTNNKKKANEKGKSRTVVKSDVEQRPLSDEFLKKLEAWKQIKSGASSTYDDCSSKRSTTNENKTPSPKIGRKDSGGRQHSKKLKDQTEKELQWFEKELTKIEREKQRLERERQKFLEREERLSKLRRSVIGNKKEVLVHTPSGFYRFEGISRKFTQKLYEWEKAQGIGPEASTFTLLKKCYPYDRRISTMCTKNIKTNTLFRSKSADSIANSNVNMLCPNLSEQPSSLSLNDVESFENNLIPSQTSSMIIRSDENLSPTEPQAVIVEVEDIIEETASPLESYLKKQEKPVYQKERNEKLMESRQNSVPKVHRSESTRAQANYNLIEQIIDMLKRLSENERRIESIEDQSIDLNELILKENTSTVCDEESAAKLKEIYEVQKRMLTDLVEKLILLQHANNAVASKISNENAYHVQTHLEEDLENVQDLSSELLQMAEKLEINAYNRSKHFNNEYSLNNTRKYYAVIPSTLGQLKSKIFETRRILSYICAASDLTNPSKKKKLTRNAYVGNNARSTSNLIDEDNEENAIKSRSGCYEEIRIPVGQGAVKKRIRYKLKDSNFQTMPDSDDGDEACDNNNRTNESSEQLDETKAGEKSPTSGDRSEEIVVDPELLEKVVVPTKSTILSLENLAIESPPSSPVTVFVKTTRKLFTPIAGLDKIESSLESPTTPSDNVETAAEDEIQPSNTEDVRPIVHLPPLPVSPPTQRKFKEISPSIRLMMVKYNQRFEQESSGYKSGGSSGSASPVAWRSPVMDRRVKSQKEKYEEEIRKMSPLLERREVQKSASLGILTAGKKQLTIHKSMSENSSKTDRCGILKSSSLAVIDTKGTVGHAQTTDDGKIVTRPSLRLNLLSIRDSLKETLPSPEERAKRIQKAKEEFLNSTPPGPSSAPPYVRTDDDYLKYPVRNRLSQISCGSDTSCESAVYEGTLMKSASAGMINVDPNTYSQFDPTVHVDGYVSLPRANKKHKNNILNNITSKFRKVKMRRNREPNKMNTITTLCRQSLVVDINEGAENQAQEQQRQEDNRKDSLTVPSISGGSSSEDTSTPSSRTGSWIRRAKFFKK